MWWKPVGEANIPWCRILATTTGFITRWTLENQFNSYIYNLFLDFCSMHYLSMLVLSLHNTRQSKITNRHCAEQPSSWRDASRTLHRPIKLIIYRRRCLVRRHMINWRSSVYDAIWSRQIQLREVSGKFKYLKNKFHFSEVHDSMNATGHVQSKWRPKVSR